MGKSLAHFTKWAKLFFYYYYYFSFKNINFCISMGYNSTFFIYHYSTLFLTLPMACSIQLVICLIIYHIIFYTSTSCNKQVFFFDITIHYLYFFKHYILSTVYNSFCYSTHYSNKGFHLPRFLLNSSNLLFILEAFAVH